MNELKVVSVDGHLVTDSREVAKNIGKRHSDLMRNINSYIQVLENAKLRSQDFFIPSNYKVENNKKTYDCYLLTRRGCDMVANKLTGEKGVLFTAAYVTKFEQMEKQQPRALTEKEQRIEMLKLSLELEEKTQQHDERITNLEDNMRISGRDEHTLNRKANRKIVQCLGGKNSPAYQKLSRSVFPKFWNEFKRHFEIPRYGELPNKRFEEGLRFIDTWQPDTSTRIEIDNLNKQESMDFGEGA